MSQEVEKKILDLRLEVEVLKDCVRMLTERTNPKNENNVVFDFTVGTEAKYHQSKVYRAFYKFGRVIGYLIPPMVVIGIIYAMAYFVGGN